MIVGIVIPAYNEEDRISSVLSNVLCFTAPDRVYVVDDGSADRTAEIAAGYEGVNLIRHEMNRGKGEALKTGFRSAIRDKAEGIITLDSDGQHDPACIPEFIATMERTGCDLVLGVRHFRIGEMPLDRIFSNLISSVTVSLVAGQRIPDSQCGYRMFRADRLKQVSIISQRFEIETELAIRAVRRNWKIAFCPIPVKYGESRSYIHRISDTQRFCRLIIRLMTESKPG
jgi:glycosyltransferase involved in cell wall biosynthesis